jgi:hypothetical protein
MQPPWLDVLDSDDLQFLKRFLFVSGSLKDLAENYSVSYPTVRQRLDRLIAKAQTADDEKLTDPFERKLKLLVALSRPTWPGSSCRLIAPPSRKESHHE